jgi:hypothetical protein
MLSPEPLYDGPMLAKFRRMLGLSQEDLARILSKGQGWKFTQGEISRLERETPWDLQRLRHLASDYFTSRGCSGDWTGAVLYVPPVTGDQVPGAHAVGDLDAGGGL